MGEKKTTYFVVLRESVIGSLARDAGTLALFVALIGIGVFIGSSALQWVGAAVGFITLISRASGKTKTLTKEQAIRFIQEMDA